MRMHTFLFLFTALVAGAVALSGYWEGASSTATIVYFICMNLVAISLVAEPTASKVQRQRAV